MKAFCGIGCCEHPSQVTIPSGESPRRIDTGIGSRKETRSIVAKTDEPEAMVTKERESRPLLNVTPESEFEVQDVNVEGIGGEEGTSQSLQTQMMGEEKEMIIARIDFI